MGNLCGPKNGGKLTKAGAGTHMHGSSSYTHDGKAARMQTPGAPRDQ